MEVNISFRMLKEEDLDLMNKWLNTNFVTEWYNKSGSSYAEVLDKYLPRIKGEQPVYSYIITNNNIAIGYIQRYMIKDFPDYSMHVDTEEKAVGIDLFIGEDKYIHKGLGSIIITKFLQKFVFTRSEIDCCIIGPEPKNKAAIRVYEKVGFKYFKTIQVPDEEESEYLMKIYRDELRGIEL